MFDNIGSKIKMLAKVICWVGIIMSCLSGLIILINGDDGAGVGLVIMIVGSLTSWVCSFFAYGFGELIDKTTEVAANTKKMAMNPPTQPSTTEDKLATLEKWRAQGLITEEEYLVKKSQL